ncbi:MAG: twin-arginine translocase TatA/TatE family subunit [Candidatus Acidiferrales bacterium]
MFSLPHIAILFVVVLVVFGPEKLPELARNFGKIMGEFRKATGELRSTFEGHMRDLERETELRTAREKATNPAVMTPLPPSESPSVDAVPPAPSSGDPAFVPADGIVAAKAPYSVPGSGRTAAMPAPAEETAPFETKPLPFDEAIPADNAPAGDRNFDAPPEKVTDGRSGSAER